MMDDVMSCMHCMVCHGGPDARGDETDATGTSASGTSRGAQSVWGAIATEMEAMRWSPAVLARALDLRYPSHEESELRLALIMRCEG